MLEFSTIEASKPRFISERIKEKKKQQGYERKNHGTRYESKKEGITRRRSQVIKVLLHNDESLNYYRNGNNPQEQEKRNGNDDSDNNAHVEIMHYVGVLGNNSKDDTLQHKKRENYIITK